MSEFKNPRSLCGVKHCRTNISDQILENIAVLRKLLFLFEVVQMESINRREIIKNRQSELLTVTSIVGVVPKKKRNTADVTKSVFFLTFIEIIMKVSLY